VDRLQARRRLTIRPINMRDFQTEVARIMAIYNDPWNDNWGFVMIHTLEELGAFVCKRYRLYQKNLV
jgi:hypothetical protein